VLNDLWNWVVGVFELIGDVSVYWLVLALALKTAERPHHARATSRVAKDLRWLRAE
jgi:hypothetical protein